jgi:2'-5' RNA ligase
MHGADKEDRMGRIAVDVVLLPDRAMTEQAIRINRGLVGTRRAAIVLGRDTCLPHISLAMGVLAEVHTETIRQLLVELARDTPVRRLRLVGVLGSTDSRGETVSVLEVEKAAELLSLHERVMEEMRPFFRYDVTADMIDDEVAAPSTLAWIRNYPSQASFDRFAPHITIGYGRVEPDLSFPYPFGVCRLALCHLGNHGTCRRVLASARLPGVGA